MTESDYNKMMLVIDKAFSIKGADFICDSCKKSYGEHYFSSCTIGCDTAKKFRNKMLEKLFYDLPWIFSSYESLSIFYKRFLK